MNRDLIQGVVKMEIDPYIHQNFIKLMEEGIYMHVYNCNTQNDSMLHQNFYCIYKTEFGK